MKMKLEEITANQVLTRMLVQRRLYMREFEDVPKEIHLGLLQYNAAKTLDFFDEETQIFYNMKVILVPTDNFIEVR